MNLDIIIKNLKYTSITGRTDIEISDIVYDSRKVKKNSLFVCLKGYNSDGHDFASRASELGAVAIITEKNINIPGITMIQVENSRAALAHVSVNFFENPSKKLTTIAITGTKGKTTTSFMIKSILENTGAKVGVIGTLGMVLNNEIIPLPNTTPESYEIQKCLSEFVKNGCKYAVLEASSIGLLRNRLDGINFDYGIFANISNDHIGENEHKDYQEYLYSKSLLFKRCKVGFINTDDKYYKQIINNHTCELLTFGINNVSDYNADNIKLINNDSNIGVKFSILGKINLQELFISTPGKFNVYNSLAAISVCHHMGIEENDIVEGLKKVKVKGRFESIPTNRDFSLFIDYAHNALSMENILNTIKQYNPKRVVTLFGAGGNRPKIRRYEMGETCGRLSDLSVITSDNPRFEEPLDIIADIEIGIKKTSGKYIIIPDRKEAIKYCIENAQKGDIIILAGKGHEEYQEIKGVKYPFDERKIAEEFLK